MANLITLARLLVLLLVVLLAYEAPSAWQFLTFLLIIVIFAGDGLDGYVARKRNEATLFGALFDIAGDRIVELTLWIVAADLDWVPVWVPLVFISRGVVVDTIRSSVSHSQHVAPFAMLRSRIGKFVVASKFMRIFYATIKACAFCGLSLINAFPDTLPTLWHYVGWLWTFLTYLSVYLAVGLCVARGLPVIIEFIQSQKQDILPKGARR